ncbi:MAG: hydrogenase iron-sulfur subunit [Deltaproteobacteria bacterium]|nr:MAG: hydrogenase iron-sulfur subunit [Deltaproteobacteria bacterium]
MQDKEFSPKILAFLCNWCSYAGADLAGISRLQYPPTIRTVRVMCSARVDPLFVIKPLLRGIDGVLIGGCHPGECHYLEGNYYTRRRMVMLKKLLEVVGIEHNRVRLEWVSASEGPRFADTVRDFTETIKKLGPNPLREK